MGIGICIACVPKIVLEVAKLPVQGKFKQGLKIMTEGSSNDVPEDIREKEPHARIQLFCEVANIKISQARAQTDKNKRGDLLLEANAVINKARLLDETDQMVHISDAYLSFAQVDYCTSLMLHVLEQYDCPAIHHC